MPIRFKWRPLGSAAIKLINSIDILAVRDSASLDQDLAPALCTPLTHMEVSRNICLLLDVGAPWHRQIPLHLASVIFPLQLGADRSQWGCCFPVLSVLPCSCSRLKNDKPSFCPHNVKWWNSPPWDASCNRNMKRFKKHLGKASEGKSLKRSLKTERQQHPA